MEQKINALNVDIGVFLRKLRAQINCKDIYIGNMTAELLMCAITCIDELVVKANIVGVREKSIDFLNDLDERHYDVRNNIMCRLCIEPISVTQDDFQNHIRKTDHIFHTRDAYTPPVQYLPEHRPFKLRSSSWQADRSRSVVRAEERDNNNSPGFFAQMHMTSASKECLEQFENSFESDSQDRTHIHTSPVQHLAERRPFEQPSKSWQVDRSRLVANAQNDNNNGSPTLFENIYLTSATEESLKRFKKTCESASQDDARNEYPFYKRERKLEKKDSMENAIDVAWKGVRLLESSKSESDSSCSSAHGFNFDSKFLIEIQGLPSSATRRDIADFFKDVHILNGLYGIHFLFDDMDGTSGHAVIQLEQLRDLQLIQKFHMNHMGDRCIEVVPANVKQFKDLVAKRQIPSKDRCVYLDGVPLTYSEQDIRLLFHDLLVERVMLIKNTSKTDVRAAYVKFSTIVDVEFAIKKHDSNINVYRASNEQMKMGDRAGLSESSQLNLVQQTQAASVMSTISMAKTPSPTKKYLKILGLPWEENEEYVLKLFQGLCIDRDNGVQMEKDKKNRNTGVAFVEFKNRDDYDKAKKVKLRSTYKYLKVLPCTEAEFLMNQK